MSIQIYEYKASDKKNCVDAFTSNVPLFFTEAEIIQFAEWLDSVHGDGIDSAAAHNYYYVLTDGDVFVGCGGFGYNEETKVATLAWGFVERKFHRKGYGEKLLTYRLDKIKVLYPGATIQIDTTQFSFSFFIKYGFTTEKITKDFYAPGMDRYDMLYRPTFS